MGADVGGRRLARFGRQAQELDMSWSFEGEVKGEEE